jgi:hypothetical protein
MKTVKFMLAVAFLLSTVTVVHAGDLPVISLDSPNMELSATLMTALSQRQSAKKADNWSDKELLARDLSDLLWAANGINREDSKKRTAASAQNAQDVDIYVFTKEGVYIYDAEAHALNPVASGDHRTDIGMMPGGGGPKPTETSGQGQAQAGGPSGDQASGPPQGQAGAPAGGMGGGKPSIDYPIELLLVSENSRFGGGTAEKKFEWGCIDSGLVAQNIMLFCAANGMVTHPKAGIDDDGMKSLLGLTDTQHCHLELPIGFEK